MASELSPIAQFILAQLIEKAKELGLAWFDKGAQMVLDGVKGEVPDEVLLAWLRDKAKA